MNSSAAGHGFGHMTGRMDEIGSDLSLRFTCKTFVQAQHQE